MINQRVLLASYPSGLPVEADFSFDEVQVPDPKDGEFLIRNLYFSLDAGFRQWMREGAGDNYLSAMAIGDPVMSLTLGRVERSRHPDFDEGMLVLGRHAWETYTLTDASDFTAALEVDPDVPLHLYLGTLGPTGLTAYFGLMDIGQPKAGETVVVSAAGGAVGSVAGQIAKALGCRTVGLTSSDDKAAWLEREIGYDVGVNYNAPGGLDGALKKACPEGVDVYFDNVGGAILDTTLTHLSQGARVVLCGMVSDYHDAEKPYGVTHLWEAITKRATLKGFMYTDEVPRYPEAMAQLGVWLDAGVIRSFDEIRDGIEATPAAFCGLFTGANRGKIMVKL